jgi:hypothetical protein
MTSPDVSCGTEGPIERGGPSAFEVKLTLPDERGIVGVSLLSFEVPSLRSTAVAMAAKIGAVDQSSISEPQAAAQRAKDAVSRRQHDIL